MEVPHNIEMEEGVLGSILLTPSLCDEIATILKPSDFYSPSNETIYNAILSLNQSSSAIDLKLLVERLRKEGNLTLIGGEAKLADLMVKTQVSAHAVHYANIVREKSDLRRLTEAANDILEGAMKDDASSKELIGVAEDKILSIGNNHGNNKPVTASDACCEMLDTIDRMAKGEMNGVETGFSRLDTMIGALHPSELVVLAARTGMGKTAFALNITTKAVVDQSKSVLFFSLEMSRTELCFRLVSAMSDVPLFKIRGNMMGDNDLKEMLKAVEKVSASKLEIVDKANITITEISSIARRENKKHGLDLIVVDYIGLIEPESNRESRQEQVAKIARRLKCLAKDLNVPVLCLAQLNRQADQTKGEKPRLSHLRESGAIEQDADVVIFIHRPGYYSDNSEDRGENGNAEIIVAKQRSGPTGSVKVKWDQQYTRFDNFEERPINPNIIRIGEHDFDEYASGRFN